MRALNIAVLALLLGCSIPLMAQTEAPASGKLVVAPAPDLSPANAAEVFVAANAAYEQGDYDSAIRDYRVLIEMEVAGGQVHYNLGNAYLRNGELGQAVAELRRSRNLLPRNEDIRANLSFARESTKDAITPPEPSPVLSTVLFWHYRLSRAELASLAVALSLIFWALALVRLFRRESEILSWLLVGVFVVLLGTLGSLVGHQFFSPTVAVVLPQEIDAFTAPDTGSVVRFKLHAGTELRVRDEREGWLRISLPDQQQGWIEAAWAEIVDG